MAAITHPRFDDEAEVRGREEAPGALARAAAVRSRDLVGRRGRAGGSPSWFSGDGRLQRPAPPARLTSVPLVAHDDLNPGPAPASVPTTVRPASLVRRPPHVAAYAPTDGAGPATARRPSAATYRRRRFVAAALFLGALLAGSWVLGALGGGSLAASERGSSSTVELPLQPVSRSTYVVAPGDTLWSIARALQPQGDVRPVVDALAAARQGRPLEVGETIVLP